jgi:hypothetical protein
MIISLDTVRAEFKEAHSWCQLQYRISCSRYSAGKGSQGLQDLDPAGQYVDQMRIEGLTGGLVEGLNRSSAKGDDQDVPDLDGIEEGERREQADEAGSDALGGHNQAALVDGIGKHPAKEV